MENNFEYYYNNVPGKGLCRNNLIYTTLISKDRKTFCQWYFNDEKYHGGHNEVVDPSLMDEKWQREIKFYQIVHKEFPEHVLCLKDIDYSSKKIYFEIENVDFWEIAGCDKNNFDLVFPQWRSQMKEMLLDYRSIGLYKYSLHPSSYFIIEGKLRGINFFFTYDDNDTPITIDSVMSHISLDRRKILYPQMQSMGIDPFEITSFDKIQQLAYKSFSTDFPDNFIQELLNAKEARHV